MTTNKKSPMPRLRTAFKSSGYTLEQLGVALGYAKLGARQCARAVLMRDDVTTYQLRKICKLLDLDPKDFV